MQLPGRKYSIANMNYRYGFNGKENDNDIGNGAQDYGMRIYDGRLVRFLSVDPITIKYPYLTPYQFASNCPISGVDIDGLEYYYAADGTYLGQGSDPKNLQVRLAKLDGHTKTGALIVHAVDIRGNVTKSWIVIHNNHDEFQQVAALGYNENTRNAGAQQATDNIVLNRVKADGQWGNTVEKVLGKFAGSKVGRTNEKRMEDLEKNPSTYHNYAVYMNTAESQRELNPNMKTATMGAIKAFLGEDITNGGTYEKGIDFFTSKPRKDGTLWKDYRTNFLTKGFKWGDDVGTFMGKETPLTVSNHIGTISGNYQFMGTASYGGNTYMKDNPDIVPKIKK
jgi:RHS repeat-associated protein